MIDRPEPLADQRRAINFIVAQTCRPVEQVRHLYEREHGRLVKAAHVQRYVDIFTYRNVIEQLALAPVQP
jgi:hypothetical protein